jgi:hypothetical protein
MYEFFLQQIMTFNFNVSICMFNVIVFKANLSLGGPTKDVTPQISKTCPTLGQHRTCIKKNFSFQIISQNLTQVTSNSKL